MKFILEDRGDPSVGISPYSAMVEVTRTPDPEFTEDEIAALKTALSDALLDGGTVMTEHEADAAIAAENAAMDEMYKNQPEPEF